MLDSMLSTAWGSNMRTSSPLLFACDHPRGSLLVPGGLVFGGDRLMHELPDASVDLMHLSYFILGEFAVKFLFDYRELSFGYSYVRVIGCSFVTGAMRVHDCFIDHMTRILR